MGYLVRFNSVLAFCLSLLLTLGTARAVAGTTQATYGDFNGDGIPDVLIQPPNETSPTQIVLGDASGQLTIPGQTLTPGYLGIPWGQDQSNIVAGDFTGNGRDDILIQSLMPGGMNAILLTNPNGQVNAFNQRFAGPYMGLDWSATSHHVLVGGFTGNGRQDVLLQTVTPTGMNMIVHANAQGVFNTTGQTWPDGYLGLAWSTQESTLYTGDFTGNGRADLLVQVTNPAANPQAPAYALLLADANGEFTRVNQFWGTSAFGADWSPATHQLLIEDVTGSGVDDIVLMSTDPNGTNYLFLGNQTGAFTQPDMMWQGRQSAKAVWTQKMVAGASISVTTTAGQASTTTQSTTSSTSRIQTAGLIQSLQAPNAIGTLDGQSGVNGGSATYHIPVVVPPGRADMQPSLSLDYSSTGGNGDVGMGWSLSGLSAITRCPATKAQDGYTQGVTYNATYDRLCLDGQHLIVVSGTYGQSGSVYRTELDSLVRVTLTGGINTTGSEFEMDYENGHKSFYGYNSNGGGTNALFITSGESFPLVWAIGQEEDAAGNNVVYNYNSYGSGEYHINSITYTGTTSGSSITQGNREVVFAYTTRSDPSSVYLAGGLTRQTKLLTTITTYATSTEVQQYSLNYAPSNATNRNLLRNIQECGYNGSSATCLPATTFTWQEPVLGFGPLQQLTLPSQVSTQSGGDSGTVGAQSYVTIDKDFDGDGQNELRYDNLNAGTEGIFWINNQNNYIDLTAFPPGVAIHADDDFLSNGLADPMVLVGSIGNYNVGVATCVTQIVCTNSTDFSVTTTSVPYNTASLTSGQFSGDGLPDIAEEEIIPNTTTQAIYLYPNNTQTNGAPSFNTGLELAPMPQNYEQFTPIGDLDGNGIPDLLIIGDGFSISDPVAVAFISNVTGLPGGTQATVKTLSSIGLNPSFPNLAYYTFADINGDGLKDFVFVLNNSDSPTWEYQLNKGGTFGPVVDTGVVAGNLNWNSATPVTNFGTIQVGDFTNDGKDELLVPVSLISTYCLIVRVWLEGEWQEVDYCGNQLFQHGYGGDDHSIYGFQMLKFVEQANGTYAPTWVSNNGIPVSVTAEAGTVQAGDLFGFGTTDVFMLSSRWFTDGHYNLECTIGDPGCATPPAEGYYTISPQGGAPDLLTGATNGLGAQASWQFQSLTALKSTQVGSGNGYSVDRPCTTAPNQPGQPPEYYCFTSSMWVVSSYSISNDKGSNNSYTYQYADAIYENQGRGLQGFKSITTYFTPASDNLDATTTVRNYRQDFPFSGVLISETVSQTSSGTVLSTISNSWPNPGGAANPSGCLASNKVYWPELNQSVVTKYGTNGENISTTTTTYGYDGYGNTTSVNAGTTDSTGTYGTTTNYLNNSPDCTNWWLNKFGEKSVQSTVSYSNPIVAQPAPITRTANYTYTALRKILTEDDDQSTADRQTTYGYDSYGNVTSVQVSSSAAPPGGGTLSNTTYYGFPSRSTTTTYTSDGYFVLTIKNPLNQVTTFTTDPGTGLPTLKSDPNGVQTTYGYDALGRKVLEQVTAPINLPATAISYSAPASVCGSGSVYSVTTSRAGYPSQTACYDLLSHTLRTATDSFTASNPSLQDTQYDVLSRVTATSEPYFSGQTEHWNSVNQYDVLSRVVEKTDAEAVQTSYVYNGLVATATTTPPDSPVFTTVTTTNSLGKLLTTVDASGSQTDFRYDVQGNPILIQDTAGHKTLATYNLLGQKIAVSDPDMGNWTYAYDILGELLQQIDAKNQIIEQRYDTLGRMATRTQPDLGTTAWTYDNCAHGIGQLCNVTQGGYQKTYTYDTLSRVSMTDELINGADYDTTTTYDTDGRVNAVTYPAGVSDQPPVANAGTNQQLLIGSHVTLNGSGSYDPDNGPLPLAYAWSQTGGPVVTLSGANSAQASFTANTVGVYTFQLSVSDGLLPASASTTVTIQPTAPGTLSINPPSISTTGNYTVSWGTSTGASSYQLLESTDGGNHFISLGTATSPDALTGKGSMSSNITYTYEAEGCGNSVCGPPSNQASVLVTLPPTTPPSISLPLNSNWDGSFTVSWGASTGVSPSYSLQLGQNIEGTIVWVFGRCDTSSTSCTFSAGSKSPGTYYARVKACNQGACSGWIQATNTITVTILSPPATAPALNGPRNTTTGTFTLNWTTVPTATSYDLYYRWARRTGSYSDWSQIYSGPATSDTVTVNILHYYNDYYVVACNQAGCGPQSNIVIVTYDITGGGQVTMPPPSSTAVLPSGTTQPATANPTTAPSSSSSVTPPPANDFDGMTARAPVPAVVTGQGEDHDTAAAQPLKVPVKSAAPRGIAITYGPPVYQAYANLHLEQASSITPQAGLSVQYSYTTTGYLQQLSNANYSSQIFWTANSQDAFGQITQETYGNGAVVSTVTTNADPMGRITGISSGSLQNLSYHWEALGNLSSRVNNLAGGASETFQYDILNRLTSAQVTNSNGVQPAVSYAYDALGDITSKSDTGSYAYTGTGPHAVTSVTGLQPGTYQYDADGNMISRSSTAITWNSDNLPTCMDAGGGTCAGGSNWSTFNYAPDKHRYYQSAEINGVNETTVYVGGFEAVTSNGVTTYRYHLTADNREVAEVNLTNSGSSVIETLSYVLTDHLGSVDVVQTRDINNNILGTNDMSFGAWGNRREPATWLPPVGTVETQADHNADRYGFTHQEMLDNVNLIHMNGRVYDPSLGRFLSVDPVFAFPTNTQSLNPYSYVMNNPLSMTDPTGYAAACSSTSVNGTACAQSGDTKSVSYTPTGSHIAETVTATKQADGSYAISSNSRQLAQMVSKAFGGNGQQNSQQGPASGNALGSSTSQGNNTAPSTAGNVTQANAVTGSQVQTDDATKQDGYYATDAQKAAISEQEYSQVEGSDSDRETKLFMANDGSTLGKTQVGCYGGDRCRVLDPAPPGGTTLIEHTHVDVAVPDMGGARSAEVRALQIVRDIPGKGDASPLSVGYVGAVFARGGEKYLFEGTYKDPTVSYLGGGNAALGQYAASHWHMGMSDNDVMQIAKDYLKGPEQ